jgi:hypothetical protein
MVVEWAMDNETFTTDRLERIMPDDFPQLRLLLWNRDPKGAISAAEAFALYERNWRFIDKAHLTEQETRLIARLTQTYGRGRMLS